MDPNKVFHFLEWLKLFGAKKKYSNRLNNSIYFDNIENSAIRENLAGTSHRKKIRIRWYEDSKNNLSNLNLEIKEREGRLNNKINIPLEDFLPLINEINIGELKEKLFEYLRDNYPNQSILNQILFPELLIKYQRSYFETEDLIRFTFDTNIQFFNIINNLLIRELTPIDYNWSVMEIKFSPDNKNKVVNLLRRTSLTPKRHSKYLTGASILKSVIYH